MICHKINWSFCREDFGSGQGAKSEHTRLYVSDEQRSPGPKAAGKMFKLFCHRPWGEKERF